MNLDTNNAQANLAPMIKQILEQATIINQMFAERLNQQEESMSYKNEEDPFRALNFSRIEEYPHES